MRVVADGSGAIIVRRAAQKVRPKLLADLFCGAGGLSNGAQRAMRELEAAEREMAMPSLFDAIDPIAERAA